MPKTLIDFMKPLASKIPPKMSIRASSFARNLYTNFIDIPAYYSPPEELTRTLWGHLKFSGPLMNAAGIFKKAEDYYIALIHGAAGILFGTFTYNPCEGDKIEGIRTPFTIYYNSDAASNRIGLKNPGIRQGLDGLKDLPKRKDFPIGASIAFVPPNEGLKHLVESMKIAEAYGVDFMEINAQCPNVQYPYGLEDILEYAGTHYLPKRNEHIPIVIKLSNDTPPKNVPKIMQLITDYHYDGVNFGNTSKNYNEARKHIRPADLRQFDFFTTNFEGGVSGAPLKENSLALSGEAARWLKNNPAGYKVEIIRTGGINNYKDLIASDDAGVSENEYLSGMWDNIDNPYEKIIKEYLASKHK